MKRAADQITADEMNRLLDQAKGMSASLSDNEAILWASLNARWRQRGGQMYLSDYELGFLRNLTLRKKAVES